ncbi:MAG: hypothetical protein V7767_15540, partial [Leeuwenhoekiella sp.]
MITKRQFSLKMREIHRYLGFFLAGIMAVYALSGISMIFRDTDAFKKQTTVEKTLEPNLSKEALAKPLGVRRVDVEKEEGGIYYFKGGTYNTQTGEAKYTKSELPVI